MREWSYIRFINDPPSLIFNFTPFWFRAMKFHSPFFRSGIFASGLLAFLLLAGYAVHDAVGYNYGIAGYSRIGCSVVLGCHGSRSAATVISVSTASSQIEAGQTYVFRLSVANPNYEYGAGCDISADNGAKLRPYDSTLQIMSGELTHVYPGQLFGSNSDSAVWLFKYTAPTKLGVAHIYIAGNAVNMDGAADNADHWNLKVDTLNVVAAGVSQSENQNTQFEIFPNPSSTGRFVLSASEISGASEVSVTDAAGRNVFHSALQPGGESSIDLSGLPNGTYFLSLRTKDGQSFLRRIVLAR